MASVETLSARRRAICDWLSAHGIDANDVTGARITVDIEVDTTATITVERLCRNADGQPFMEDGDVARDEPVMVPLTCWPENI